MSRDVDDDHGSSLFFPNGDSSDVNSRILFIAIVTLSAVVVVVVMLHVYVRYILRRQARRRVTGVGIIARVHSDEAPKRGLEASVIASLPVLKYEGGCDDHELDRLGQNTECTVCLSLFDNGQMIRVLPNCKHNFHVECIDKWLESHSSCPVCRHEVEVGLTILPLPREPSARLGVGVGTPSAPPLERVISVGVAVEGTSDEMVQSSIKGNGTSSRLSSFRRMLSMDRSSRRNNSCTQDGIDDLERQ